MAGGWWILSFTRLSYQTSEHPGFGLSRFNGSSELVISCSYFGRRWCEITDLLFIYLFINQLSIYLLTTTTNKTHTNNNTMTERYIKFMCPCRWVQWPDTWTTTATAAAAVSDIVFCRFWIAPGMLFDYYFWRSHSLRWHDHLWMAGCNDDVDGILPMWRWAWIRLVRRVTTLVSLPLTLALSRCIYHFYHSVSIVLISLSSSEGHPRWCPPR